VESIQVYIVYATVLKSLHMIRTAFHRVTDLVYSEMPEYGDRHMSFLFPLSTLDNQIQTAQQTRSRKNPQPKEDISYQSSPTHEPRTAQGD
jgi:hypothetical protein